MFHIVIKYTYNYSERLNFMKRIIAMLLSVIMAVTVVCVPAFAADNDTAAEPAVSAVSLDSAADALHSARRRRSGRTPKGAWHTP